MTVAIMMANLKYFPLFLPYIFIEALGTSDEEAEFQKSIGPEPKIGSTFCREGFRKFQGNYSAFLI